MCCIDKDEMPIRTLMGSAVEEEAVSQPPVWQAAYTLPENSGRSRVVYARIFQPGFGTDDR
jgi:hypothetical protein